MPELGEIGLDPAVQGVPVKKKRSVDDDLFERHNHNISLENSVSVIAFVILNKQD